MSTSAKQAGDTSLSCKDTILPKRFILCHPEGDMRVMFLLWDATSGNKSLKIVEIPIKTAPRALNNPDFPEK